MDTTRALARNVVNIRYEDLPEKAAQITKMCILDTLGVMLAASTLGEGCKEMVELAKEGGGKKESTVLAFGGKVPAWMAAFANGSMCHSLDYDDGHDQAHVHPTAGTLTAALAVAERVGKVNGKDFITAVALGNDLTCRLGLCPIRDPMLYGFLPPLLGCFGSAAAAGKILGLNEDQMVSALAFVFHQATGSLEMATPGSVFRSIREAFVGKAGVLSALMAQKNLAGGENVLEGKYGLFNLHFRGEYDPAPLTADLGSRFEGVNVVFKPWPSCREIHAPIDATLTLVQEHHIDPEHVAEVVLVVKPSDQGVVEPLAEKRAPKKAIDAKFSSPFCVALALTYGKVSIAGFQPESLNDPAVLRMAQKINYEFNPEFSGKESRTALVKVRMDDGKTYSERVDFPYGSPKKPISEEDLILKFRDCVRYSLKPLSEKEVDKLVQMITRLEHLDDVSKLLRLCG